MFMQEAQNSTLGLVSHFVVSSVLGPGRGRTYAPRAYDFMDIIFGTYYFLDIFGVMSLDILIDMLRVIPFVLPCLADGFPC